MEMKDAKLLLDEATIRDFLSHMSKLLAVIRDSPLSTRLPTETYTEIRGGAAEGKPFHWSLVLLLSTKDSHVRDFTEQVKIWTQMTQPNGHVEVQHMRKEIA